MQSLGYQSLTTTQYRKGGERTKSQIHLTCKRLDIIKADTIQQVCTKKKVEKTHQFQNSMTLQSYLGSRT